MAEEEKKDVSGEANAADSTQQSTSAEAQQAQEQEEVVPKKAFLARVGEETEKRKRAEADADAARADAATARADAAALKTQGQPQIYTRQQLKAYVDAGQISEDRMWDIWDQQKDAQYAQMVRQTVQQDRERATWDAKLAAYNRVLPGWETVGTEQNRKAQPFYADLVYGGMDPNASKTKAMALRLAFGEPEVLERSAAVEDVTARERDTSPESRSSSDRRSQHNGKVDWRKALSVEERDFYLDQISQEKMTEKEVREEVEWSMHQTLNPKLRAKMLARMK